MVHLLPGPFHVLHPFTPAPDAHDVTRALYIAQLGVDHDDRPVPRRLFHLLQVRQHAVPDDVLRGDEDEVVVVWLRDVTADGPAGDELLRVAPVHHVQDPGHAR